MVGSNCFRFQSDSGTKALSSIQEWGEQEIYIELALELAPLI
jgi:hypothetical protein